MKSIIGNMFSRIMASVIVASLMVAITNVFMGVSFAQVLPPVPEVDLFEKIADLILNWKSMGTIAKGSVIVMVLTQIVKQVKDFKYKNVLVALLAIAYGVFEAMTGDVSVKSAIVTVMFSGGGAVFLYNALKPFLKSIPFLDFLNLGSK